MNWFLLIIAGLFEVGFASCLGKAKETTGATSWYWLGGFFVCLTVSMALLYKASQTLPIGTAYAVWVGIGAVGTAVIGMTLLGEPASLVRVLSLGLIVAGIVGLKLSSPA